MKSFVLSRPGRVVFLIAVLVGWRANAIAARYEGDVWNLLDARAVLAEASKITPASFPDCDDATVDQKSMRVYHEDGTAECQDDTYTKVLTEKGRRRNTTVTLNFQIPYTTVDVVKLEVIKPSGEVEAVDVAQNSKESIDDSQMEMNIYDPNSRLLRVNIPKLEIGDVVHSVVRTNVDRAIIPGEYAEDEMFEGPGYIRHALYEVHAPAKKPLRQIRLRNEIPNTISTSTETAEQGQTLIYRWDAHRVPRMYEEPAMPPSFVVLQRLSVSTTADWNMVSQWGWKLDLPHIDATDDDLKKTVAELTTGKTNELDKIHAIFYYVSKDIRYMGITPEKDLPGFEPHDVKLTFAKKYGVCRDKAALLVAMLRTANIPAYPVLVSYGLKKDTDVPNPFFNHEIVSVDRGDRHYLLMDPTDENTRDLLPAQEGNQSYLVLRPEGEVIRTSPVNNPDDSMVRVVTTGTLNANGAVEAHTALSFDGVNDNAYRGAFAQMKSDDRWRFFESRVKNALPGAVLKSLKISPDSLLDSSTGLRVDLDFSAPNAVAYGNGKALVSMPWIGKNTGIVNFILQGVGLEKRKYPMETEVACGVREDITLNTAPEFSGAFSIPQCAPTEDDALSYNRTFTFGDGRLSASRELKIKTVEFSPEQYLELKKTIASMENDDRKAPLLRTSVSGDAITALPTSGLVPPSTADSRILQLTKELEVQDAHTATLHISYTKRVLNYNGKKREAEAKIPYNPATEDVHVIHAIVTSKDGKRQEISPEEMNRMDEGWNASAKRYTGSKILVMSLPGVDIDSTIDLEYEIKLHDRPFLARFEAFQSEEACDEETFRVITPLNIPLLHTLRGNRSVVQASETQNATQRIYEWHASHLDALPDEANTPPNWLYQTGVEYFVGDAGAYWQSLETAFGKHRDASTAAQARAKQLAESSKTKIETVIAIRNEVDRAIRDAGPSFLELPLSELSDADRTLQDGYGHSADRAILLAAMLRAVGLDAEWVWSSDLPDISAVSDTVRGIPTPYLFSEPLVRVRLDGKSYYLNDTDQYAHLGATPHDGDLAMEGAKGDLLTVAALEEAPRKMETQIRLRIGDDGKARIDILRRYFGTEWGEKKKFFAELPPEERRRYHQEIVSQVGQSARPVSDLTTDFDVYPGVESFSVEMDHYGVVDGRYLYFDLPSHARLVPLYTDQRALPLFIEGRDQNLVQTEILLPPSHRRVLISPHERNVAAPTAAGSVSVNTTETAGQLVITQAFNLAPAIISPSDYPELARLESSVENKSSRLLLLEDPAQPVAMR